MVLYKLIDIKFKYDDSFVLKNINFDIEKNECIAIIGPNGAGKSTLLKIMDFLFPPTSGEIYFDGMKIEKNMIKNVKAISWIRKRIGFVFQDPDVELFSSTVYEDLIFGPVHLGLDEKEIEQRVKYVSEMLKIKNILHKPPFNLSDGEKKKAAIASVLTMDPDVLMVDEPTSNLDPKSKKDIVNILKFLWQNGKTLILTTHEIGIIRNFVKRVIILNNGQIVADDDPENILENKEILINNNLE
ncbi:MAG: energy-coupling factor ABC transporter ATP-binding protein [Thermoplasmata archaeon]